MIHILYRDAIALMGLSLLAGQVVHNEKMTGTMKTLFLSLVIAADADILTFAPVSLLRDPASALFAAVSCAVRPLLLYFSILLLRRQKQSLSFRLLLLAPAAANFLIASAAGFRRSVNSRTALCITCAVYLLLFLVFAFREPHRKWSIEAAVLTACMGCLSIFLEPGAGDLQISFLHNAVALCIFAYYACYQTHWLPVESAAQKQAEEERLLAAVMERLRPHFLFNALNAISYLIRTDTEQAAAALLHFSSHLRKMLDSLRQREPVSFSLELEHVESYLFLEQLRLASPLHIHYDIQCSQFSVPRLTLLPIVENAVRHSAEKPDGGGTLLISTQETGNAYVIKAADNGVGFDPFLLAAKDARASARIEDVRRRLAGSGTLHMESSPSAGTIVTISIFKTKNS